MSPHPEDVEFWQKLSLYLLPLPVAWLALSLMSLHMKYHGLGINMAANNGFLLIFVAPVLLAGLYAVAWAGLRLARKLTRSPRLAVLFAAALVVLAGLGAFLVKAHYDLRQGSERPTDTVSFLHYYLRQTLGEGPRP